MISVKIALKSATQTRGISFQTYHLPNHVDTVKSLIEALVDIEIDKHEANGKEEKALSQEALDAMVISGKVSFGFRYHPKNIDRQHAKEVALLAFEDKLYTIFLNDMELTTLKTALSLEAEDTLTFIRFTMLTGRYY